MPKSKSPSLHLPRRCFLKGVGAGALILPFASYRALAEPSTSVLFTLGVGSGDPDANSVVLWTRLAPDPLALDGGNSAAPVTVTWRVATDPSMQNVLQAGDVVANRKSGHNVRVLARNLPSNATLYYQFSALGETSSIGRTRTFPPAFTDPGEMRFALTSCQDYQSGFYNAWRDVVTQDVDFVLQVGDYLYEYGPSDDPEAPRLHVGGETVTIQDYRRRYAQYRLDPDLRAAHESAPFICTTDDHEVDNNYAALIPEDDQDAAAFLQRRSQAYLAYVEAMPIRTVRRALGAGAGALAGGAVDYRMYRSLNYGSLASIAVLDTRQYRDDQACGDGLQICPEAAEPLRTMLGPEQEQFLTAQLTQSAARWRIVQQQVMFMQWDLGALLGTSGFFNVDAWDGYSAQRNRLLNVLSNLPNSNNIVLTGDIHSSWAADLKADYSDPTSATVGAEFVCAGVSSTFGGDDNDALVRSTLPSNPHIRFFDGLRRGYALCSVTNNQWRTDFRLVDNNLVNDSSVTTRATWVVNDGEPGVQLLN